MKTVHTAPLIGSYFEIRSLSISENVILCLICSDTWVRFSLISLLNSFHYQGPVVCNLPCFKGDNDNKATGWPCLSHL